MGTEKGFEKFLFFLLLAFGIILVILGLYFYCDSQDCDAADFDSIDIKQELNKI